MGKLNFQENLDILYNIRQLYITWDMYTNVSFCNLEVIDNIIDIVMFDMQVAISIAPGTILFILIK
ncbi:hypothetical protein DFW37_17910 [Clostridioides difficile]|nr:hypothetical protein [Clostridioides difficile]